MSKPMQLQLFGLPALDIAGIGSSLRLNNPTLLMLYLANKADWVSRSELAFLFRPDEEEARALKIVRLLLYRAKQIDWVSDNLEIERRKVRFTINTDTKLFKDAISQQNWQEARNIYKQAFFAGFSTADLATYNAWIELERFDYEVNYRDALISYSTALESQGNYNGASEVIGDLLELNPIAEDFMQDYLRNIYLSGQREKALLIYEQFCKQLAQEYDALPMQKTQELIEIIKTNKNLEAKTSNQVIISRSTLKTHSLPAQSTHFIGRKADIKKLNKRIKDPNCHLISIIGLGGIGKTRLAIELANQNKNKFADGIYFIELAKISRADELNNQVAQILGLTLAPQQKAIDQIKNYLINKKALLVFDNFEHILDATAVLQEYLAGSSTIKLIVTSRQRLQLHSEWVYDLEGLNYPDDNNEQNLEEYDALNLFISSAKRVSPKLKLSNEDINTIAKISKQVQGLPLALELAASWCRIMSVDRICQELCKDYSLLESQYSDVADKHKNMKAIWEQTWQNLSQKKRETLAKFTVFSGGGTLEAIENVTNTHFTVLLSLVNESLLKRIPPDRFDIHELLKQFASSKLTFSLEKTQNLHTCTYTKLAADNSFKQDGNKLQHNFLDNLDNDQANIQKAWWQLIAKEDFKQLSILQSALGYMFFSKARYQEGSEFYIKSIDELSNDKISTEKKLFVASIHYSLADLLMPQGNWQDAQKNLQQAVDILKDEPAFMQRANILESKARIHYFKGEFKQAKQVMLEANKLIKKTDNSQLKANMLHTLAIVITQLKEYHEAETYYHKALSAYKEIDDTGNITITLDNLAALKIKSKNLDEAQKLLLEALKISQQTGAVRATSNIKNTMGGVFYRQKEYLESKKHLLEALTLSKKIGDNTLMIGINIGLSKTYIKLKNSELTKKHLQKSLELAQVLDSELQYLEIILAYSQYLFANNKELEALPFLAIVLQHKEIQDFSTSEANELKAKLNKELVKKLDNKKYKNAKIKDLIKEINIKLEHYS